MKQLTIEQIIALFNSKGYAFFEKGDFNLNIFSIRNTDMTPNKFNDKIYCVFKASGKWVIKSWDCTTDPGIYYLKNPINVEGTAILVPGQYRGSHQLALHQGKYKALCQRKPVNVYRDADRDGEFDLNEATIDNGLFGINIHKAGLKSVQVDKWSAGCTVFAKSTDFDDLITLCDECAKVYGNSFTYTLFNQKDIA